MGLFDTIGRIVELPFSAAVDVVKLTPKIMDGDDDLLEHTKHKINQISESIDE